MVVGQGALAHQAVGDRNAEMIDDRAELIPSLCQHDAAADVDHRLVRLGHATHDLACSSHIERRLAQRAGVAFESSEKVRVDFRGEHVHRHVDEHRARLAAFG
jgi:hypothetical protein